MGKRIPALLASILLCEAVGFIGGFFTISAIPTWYAALTKPSLSPPNWVFGPAWTILYALMGISLYLIWEEGIKKKKVRQAIFLFGIHLLVNFSWSAVFFGLKNSFGALLVIVVLWLLIVAVIYKFWQIKTLAAILLFPYLFWVSFATYLNFAIWLLNK